MQHAYGNLGLNNDLAVVNNLYVRFLPTTNQLAALDSIMDAQGLELFNTPVDYQVLYEGDYYQDPSVPDSLPTWQYAVVPPSFQFPAVIQAQTLASIHIPADNYTAVETEAERLASIQDSLNMSGMGAMAMNKNVIPYSKEGTVKPNVLQCGSGYEWSYSLNKCVPILPDDCSFGYHWDGNRCVPDQQGPPPIQPPPAADAAIPAGYIYVHDTNLPSIASGGSDIGVRKVRVVARRWFKIDRAFTDNNGHFVFNKKFKHKVRIIEKFKNADAYIYGLRGARLWQMIFPVKRTFGIFSGNKSNLMLHNNQDGPVNSKANRYWAAATVHNAVQEHNDYATQFGFSKMPAVMHIFITDWASYAGSSSTPLFRERRLFGFLPPTYFVNNFMVWTGKHYVDGGIVAVANIASKIGVDMILDYQPTRDQFYSDEIKETAYHEMSHASQYSQVGDTWYGNFVTDELNEVQNHPGNNDQYNPYGTGTTSNSPIIALGEAWGYHMGHFLADQRYGVNAYCEYEGQQFSYCPNLTNHPDIDVLEYFVPSYLTDAFHWIPKGLMYDLMDNGEPPQTLVNDAVSGITIAQVFSALQSDVTTLAQYKSRLLQQIGANQSTTTNINNLFNSYGY